MLANATGRASCTDVVRDVPSASAENEGAEPSTVRVELGQRSYDVRVTSGIAGLGAFAGTALEARSPGRSRRAALVVGDAHVESIARAVAEELRGAGFEPRVTLIAPGEESKSLNTSRTLFEALVEARADRHACVCAVGGGVVGDVAGFVAATYARGIALLMVPTTLLAQVDSAVGGKVGVNLPGAKNIIGAFHQPVGVWSDVGALRTLPDRELRCGLAEVIKYGVILDREFFEMLECDVESLLARDETKLRAVVARSCRLKADVVSADEREQTGLRAVLNFGHTIGHAIEAVDGYRGRFRHGEAVAAGMAAEAQLATRRGWIDEATERRIARLPARAGLPTTVPGLDPDALTRAVRIDKKNRDGRVRFVLPREIGHVEETDVEDEAIAQICHEITLAGHE